MHDRAINNCKPFLPDVPLHQDPLHKPSSLQQNANKVNQNPNINLGKALYLKQFKDWTNHFFKG